MQPVRVEEVPQKEVEAIENALDRIVAVTDRIVTCWRLRGWALWVLRRSDGSIVRVCVERQGQEQRMEVRRRSAINPGVLFVHKFVIIPDTDKEMTSSAVRHIRKVA